MTRTIVIGAMLFVIFAVVFAPASLVRNTMPADAGVELLAPSGTLWNGSGTLYVGDRPAGELTWRFRPAALIDGKLGYAVDLGGPEHALTGTVAAGVGELAVNLSGSASASFANRWLAPYDIVIAGDLALEAVELSVPYRDVAAGGAGGALTWDGGPVRYRLGGRSHAGDLPPLVAYLGDGLEAMVYPQDGQTPLLLAEVLPNGFVKIGVTQLMTRLSGNPWPGSNADHEVVLEVEEQLF